MDQDHSFSFKETLIEIRDNVQDLREDFEKFKGDAMEFRTKVVLKSELDLWQDAKKSTRRWAVATIISGFVAAAAAAGLVISLIQGS